MRERLSAGNQRVDVLRLAEVLGCRVSSTRINKTGMVQADLCPDIGRDRFRLRVDPEPPGGWGETVGAARERLARHRLRFRVSHELGHTFFYERRKGKGPTRARRWTSNEEAWCDEFARSLLVPRTAAAALPATADSVFRLQGRFDVSLEVAARALADANRDASVALWFWPPDADRPRESLLYQWASRDAEELRRWRQSPVVTRALADGESAGRMTSLSVPTRKTAATARCAKRRRQVVVVAE